MGKVKETRPGDDLQYQAYVVDRLMQQLVEAGIGADDDRLVLDTIEGETEALEAVSKTLRWLAEQKAHAEALKALEADYKARRDRYEARIESGRKALLNFVDEFFPRGLERPEATLSVRDGKAALIFAGDFDVKNLPPTLTRVKTEPDKDAIKAALEAKEAVQGVTLSNGSRVLTIRVK